MAGSAFSRYVRSLAAIRLSLVLQGSALMQIGRDKVVRMDYTLTGPGGNVLDSSQGREPLVYMQGAGNIIHGLERELEGKSAGDQIKVTVPAKDAYGERDDRMVQSVPREMF